MKSLIFGASGGLAEAIAHALLARGWHVDLVTRRPKQETVEHKFQNMAHENRARVFAVDHKYSSFSPELPCNAYFFTQALFSPKPIVAMEDGEIAQEIEVGLVDIIQLVKGMLFNILLTLENAAIIVSSAQPPPTPDSGTPPSIVRSSMVCWALSAP